MNSTFKPTATWYKDADSYWKGIASDIDGMLGGLEQVHAPDIRDSQIFLSKQTAKPTYACDCGAGIGRVSKHLLLPHFDRVDLVEQNKEFLTQAQSTYLTPDELRRVGEVLAVGLQDFMPVAKRYDVIWCQWVLSHLTDQDLVLFLKRAQRGLAEGGVICVKENVVERGSYVVDQMDSSVTRSEGVFEKLFKEAGLTVTKKQLQTGFPSGLFGVWMWSLHCNKSTGEIYAPK